MRKTDLSVYLRLCWSMILAVDACPCLWPETNSSLRSRRIVLDTADNLRTNFRISVV